MKTPFVLAMFLICSFAHGQNKDHQQLREVDSIRYVMDTVVKVFLNYSYHSNNIRKKDVKTAYALAKNAKNISDLRPAIEYLFKKTRDYHGWFQYDTLQIKWNNTELPERKTTEAVSAGFQQPNRIGAQLIDDSIAYVRIRFIPFNLERMNKQAEAFQKALCDLGPSRIKGVIIDLRLNAGGSMYPMISGMSALLGDGVVGGHENAAHKKTFYKIEKGNLIVPGELSTDISFFCKDIQAVMPVAVLIGSNTGSSGEMTALSFMGRPNTRFFGERSAMYTTTTKGFYFAKGRGVVLATDMMIDRNGKSYPNGIDPDEFIPGGDDFIDLKKDIKIQAAVKWLRSR